MAIHSYFFNALANEDGSWDRVYNAEDFSNYLNLIVGSGVFPNPSTNLQVLAGSGFNLVVKAGEGWIDGKKLANTTDFTITLDGSDVLLNRIDCIIMYLDYSERAMGISVLKGTPAAEPTAPELTRTSTRIEYCLAQVAVNKQVTSITQANITDTRADSDVCGWVAGLIQQVDTSTLFNQWQSAYSQYYATVKQQLDDFMETLTEELNVNTYLVQYTKFVTLQQGSSNIIPLNIKEYTYSATDIIDVYINGLMGVPTEDFLVDDRQSPPEIHVNVTGSTQTTNEVYIRIFKSKIALNTQVVDLNGNAIVTSENENLFALGD